METRYSSARSQGVGAQGHKNVNSEEADDDLSNQAKRDTSKLRSAMTSILKLSYE